MIGHEKHPDPNKDEYYTPPETYEIIKNWAIGKISEKYKDYEIVRPFYKGHDYTKVDYTGKLVIDNPPFSICGQIATFYEERNIPFFLFHTTPGIGYYFCRFAVIILGNIKYYYRGEKLKSVDTSFFTNILPKNKIILAGHLKKEIKYAEAHFSA